MAKRLTHCQGEGHFVVLFMTCERESHETTSCGLISAFSLAQPRSISMFECKLISQRSSGWLVAMRELLFPVRKRSRLGQKQQDTCMRQRRSNLACRWNSRDKLPPTPASHKVVSDSLVMETFPALYTTLESLPSWPSIFIAETYELFPHRLGFEEILNILCGAVGGGGRADFMHRKLALCP